MPEVQLTLFDIGGSEQLEKPLRDICEELMQHQLARNTQLAYAHCWLRFARWCESVGREPGPVTPASIETVRLFIAWCIQTGLRIETAKLCIAAIRHKYRQAGLPPPMDNTVRRLVSNAARKLKEKPGGKAAITPMQLRRMVRTESDDPYGARNRAILVLTFALGWRRSEMAGLDLSDLAFTRKAVVVRLGASKTDQEGKGRQVRVPLGQRELTCPVRNLRAWIEARGQWPGPLFCRMSSNHWPMKRGIRGNTVCDVVKRALKRVGEDPAIYGAHSLRAGMATAAAENGATETAIMHRTGLKSYRMVQRYVRPARAWRLDPLAGVL